MDRWNTINDKEGKYYWVTNLVMMAHGMQANCTVLPYTMSAAKTIAHTRDFQEENFAFVVHDQEKYIFVLFSNSHLRKLLGLKAK